MAITQQLGGDVVTDQDRDTPAACLGAHPCCDLQPLRIAPNGDLAEALHEVLGPPKTLPQLPGSASLFLWAIGAVGAWQFSRSAFKADLSSMPEWFHSGAPDQVGHAFCIDLTSPQTMLPVPGEPKLERLQRQPRASFTELRSPCQSWHREPLSPRAPPA